MEDTGFHYEDEKGGWESLEIAPTLHPGGLRRTCGELQPGDPGPGFPFPAAGGEQVEPGGGGGAGGRGAVPGRAAGREGARSSVPGRTPSLAALPHAGSRGGSLGKFSLPTPSRKPLPLPSLPCGPNPRVSVDLPQRAQRRAGTHGADRPGCRVQGPRGMGRHGVHGPGFRIEEAEAPGSRSACPERVTRSWSGRGAR